MLNMFTGQSPPLLHVVHVFVYRTGLVFYCAFFLLTLSDVFVTFMWDSCTFEGPVCNISEGSIGMRLFLVR